MDVSPSLRIWILSIFETGIVQFGENLNANLEQAMGKKKPPSSICLWARLNDSNLAKTVWKSAAFWPKLIDLGWNLLSQNIFTYAQHGKNYYISNAPVKYWDIYPHPWIYAYVNVKDTCTNYPHDCTFMSCAVATASSFTFKFPGIRWLRWPRTLTNFSITVPWSRRFSNTATRFTACSIRSPRTPGCCKSKASYHC